MGKFKVICDHCKGTGKSGNCDWCEGAGHTTVVTQGDIVPLGVIEEIKPNHINIGTIGHVGHGKTTIYQSLLKILKNK